jgi:hypothetical protein
VIAAVALSTDAVIARRAIATIQIFAPSGFSEVFLPQNGPCPGWPDGLDGASGGVGVIHAFG